MLRIVVMVLTITTLAHPAFADVTGPATVVDGDPSSSPASRFGS